MKYLFMIIALFSIVVCSNLTAQVANTQTIGTYYVSEVQNINVSYNEAEFITLAQYVLYTRYGQRSHDLSTEVLASEWLDLIVDYMGKTSNPNFLTFSEDIDPYIDATDVKYIVGPNGLFSYLVHEINTLPVNDQTRIADYILLLSINERIFADMDKFNYKDLEIPKPYIQLHELAEKELILIQEQTGALSSTTLDLYNKGKAAESLSTKSFLSSVKKFIVKDVSSTTQENLITLIKTTPSFYTEESVEFLISTALKEKYLDKARNYLTQANKIMFEIPGTNKALESKLEAAESLLMERPSNALLARIKENYPSYGNHVNDKEVVTKMIRTLAFAYHGELKNLALTQIALGTPENNFEDNIFEAYSKVVGSSFLITELDHLVDALRVMIFCKNDAIQISAQEKIATVELFTSSIGGSLTKYFFGCIEGTLFPIEEEMFETIETGTFLSSQEKMNGLKRFNEIKAVIKK